MELKNTDMVEAAGRIINRSGTDALSIEELSREMGVDQHQLSPYFRNNDDILIMVLQSLEKDIKELVSDSLSLNGASEKELETLFGRLNNLFGLKPYYLSIIFSTESAERIPAIQEIMLRIKSIAKTYLMQVINHAKNEKMHKTKGATESMATNILDSFRLFMNEQRVIDKMVRDIEILKNTQDS
jgi:AcrR family transcriptional regulator